MGLLKMERKTLIRHLSKDLNEMGSKEGLAMSIFGYRLF